MKILLTGGGTGGHFYPLVAVAREIQKVSRKRRLIEPEIIFASDAPYDEKLLFEENIRFLKLPAGKLRRYFSFFNFFAPFKIVLGSFLAFIKIYFEMPDVIFSKGGYASMPVLIAARFFKIPLFIHESDFVPGRANSFAKKFAERIAVSFAESVKYFPENKTAFTGNPIRKTVIGGSFNEAKDIFNLTSSFLEDGKKFSPPVILIIGSSQGAQKINDLVLEVLPDLIEKYQIIHQCGVKNFEETKKISEMILKNSEHKDRYHLFGFLDEAEYRNGSYAASFAVSRASAGAIFEIAAWGKPSILVPITNSAQNHQRENAWNYAKAGAAEVIEEENFTPHIFLSELNNILTDKEKIEKMSKAARNFSRPDAAEKIAEETINLALKHAD